MKRKKTNSEDGNGSNTGSQVQSSRVGSQNIGKLKNMENTISTGRRWEEMENDVLVKIFLLLDLKELKSSISRVCSSWRLASCDPILWKTIDFGSMQSKFIRIPSPPYVWVADTSDKFLMRALENVLGLSCGHARCLIFHIDLYPKDDHLIYTAERSLHLRTLVLPAWNRITKAGICAVRKWTKLESLTMSSIQEPSYLLEEIGMNCKNLTQLKIMGSFEVLFASAIATFLPRLKVLSLRCSLLQKEALDIILDSLEHLEVLNISHCLFIETPLSPAASKRPVRKVDKSIISKASRLQTFLTCQDKGCALCERMRIDEGYLRWYKCEEGSWRKDELSCLNY